MSKRYLRGAAWALSCLLACHTDVAHAPGTSSDTTFDILQPATTRPPGKVCLLDADCGVGRYCELRVCVDGCPEDAACDGGTCNAHGRCIGDGEAPLALSAQPVLATRTTSVRPGDPAATTVLRNDSPHPLTYRLAAGSPALTFDPAPAVLEAGQEVELAVALDWAQISPDDRVLPVQIVAGGGTLLWSIEVKGLPQPGYFEGALQHEAGDVGLGSAALALELDFRDDGTIAGRVRGDASPLWPLPVVVTGTWTAGGDVVVVLRDRLPAEDWRHSPIARELGREFILSGKHTADQIAGSVHEALTGMRSAPVELEGSFVLRRRGPLGGLVLPAAYVPEDATAPTWLAPPSLDFEACALLGKSFGTDQTLVEPSAACSACATGGCTAADRIECAGVLREATFNIDAVLAPLQGGQDVSPPAGSDTWTDCMAETPSYGDDGRTCLDIDGMRCAHALFRTGAAQTPGPWGEAFSHMAATFAADEGRAATLLALETEVDVALSFKDSLGEPVADALAREQKLLASSRTRLAAALAPTLVPVYPSSLEWLANNADYDSLARARTIPLELLAQYARATAAWARLGHRAGQDAADLRTAVRLGMIAAHAASAELAERLADDADAAPGLQALGSVLDTLAGAYAELAEGGSRFGYPAAYVPLALDQADITEGRTNFEAVRELATGDLELLEQITAEAWQAIRDYETKSHDLAATALRIQDEYGSKLRSYCGSLPGQNAPNLATCGDHGGQIAELRANIEATTLRINHAAQAVQNNLDAVEVEEQRFAAELAAHAELEQAVADAQGKIINVVTYYGTARSAAEQAAAIAECTRVRASANAEYQSLIAGCKQQTQQALLSGPGVFGFSTPDWRGLVLARDQCEAQKAAHVEATDNQCESIMANAELAGEMDELSRNEDLELRMINAEMDAIIRAGELNVRRAESEARVKNLRSEALLLQIEVREAELARDTAMTAMSSAFQEVGALLIDQANAVGLLVDDSPDNPLKRPNFLAARLAAAGRVLPAREQTMRRVYLALRAIEYQINQELPTLRNSLAAARAPADFVSIVTCLDTIAEDYRLEQGAAQAYVTEVSLRADLFGMKSDIPDVDGSPATPAEQFTALLADPLHRAPDGSVHLPFTLSAFEHALFSASLCDDRLEQVEVKLVGDYLGDAEAEVILTRQGLAGVRRCDGAELPDWDAYVPYSFERDELVVQAGVNDWGTAGANWGFAAWPVHGEQWTLTIPAADLAPANSDFDVRRISDVVLRLRHRAGTLAPQGQGLFTPDCG